MITIDKENGIFHLHNAQVSYVLQVVRDRYVLHRYWGRPLKTFRDSSPMQAIDRAFSPQPAAWANERTFSLDVLPQEYPAYGLGEVREGASVCVGRHENGLRPHGEIGIHSLRCGNEVGRHEIIIANGAETITLKHEAESRMLFAQGALAAAAYIIGKAPGLYDMRDMLA